MGRPKLIIRAAFHPDNLVSLQVNSETVKDILSSKKSYAGLLCGLIFFMWSMSASGQEAERDTSWKSGGFVGITFNQVNLSHWSQGGDNSLSLSSTLNLFANYVKVKKSWSNNLDLGYSLTKTSNNPMRKSDDKIDLTSKFGYKIDDSKWFYSALGNFKSQFAAGYNFPNDSVPVSKFLAPAFLTLSIGINYKPTDYLEIFVSPATGKWTFVTDQDLADAGAFGVEPARVDASGVPVVGTGKTVRSEFGAYMNIMFKKDIMQNVTLSSKLELFNNYTDKDKDNAKNVDLNWESLLLMKVNKWITASVSVQVIADDNISKQTQFKDVISVGFGYKFHN